ncbi:MAG: hypothetical protein JXA51_03755 [Dehalococcoidales bacterium]|nr:hypothetical protein [Dehalococcoidales bacterium]
MTGEELEKLMQEISGELERLNIDPDSPPDNDDNKHTRVLKARKKALEKIKVAKEKRNIDREAKACLEYAIITEYTERSPLWLILARVKLASWFRFY